MIKFQCKAILFDMDGTLLQSNEASEIVWQKWAFERNIPMEEIRKVHHGRRTMETISLVAPHLDAEAETLVVNKINESVETGVYPIEGVNEFYHSLPLEKCAVVTAANRKMMGIRFGQVGLKYPHTIITSDRLQRGKPDPEGYLMAAAELGVDPKDCLVFEDAPAGLIAAQRADMRSIAITTHYTPEQLKAEMGDEWRPLLFLSDYRMLTLESLKEGLMTITFANRNN